MIHFAAQPRTSLGVLQNVRTDVLEELVRYYANKANRLQKEMPVGMQRDGRVATEKEENEYQRKLRRWLTVLEPNRVNMRATLAWLRSGGPNKTAVQLASAQNPAELAGGPALKKIRLEALSQRLQGDRQSVVKVKEALELVERELRGGAAPQHGGGAAAAPPPLRRQTMKTTTLIF